MTDGKIFIVTVKEYYVFLTREFNMVVVNEKILGNAYYQIEFGNKEIIVSISYENIVDYLQVTILKLQNGKMPDYDDKEHTLHLNRLNIIAFSKADVNAIHSNNECFV